MGTTRKDVMGSFTKAGSKIKEKYGRISIANKLKIFVALLLIPVVIFMCLPFAGLSGKVSVGGSVANNSKEIDIISPDNEITDVTLMDMLTHKDLSKYKIYGVEIGDVGLFDVSLYDLITSPIPNYGIIDTVDTILNGKVTEVLQNEDIKNFIRQNFGDNSQAIIDIMDIANQYVGQAKDIMTTVKTVSDSIYDVSYSIRSTIASINSAKFNVELALSIIPILILLGVLLLLKKKPSYAPAVIFTVSTALIIIAGVLVSVINGMIAGYMGSIVGELNSSIMSAITTSIPNLQGVLSIFGISANVNIGLYLSCGIGYYLLLLAVAIMAVISYIYPSCQKKQLSK